MRKVTSQHIAQILFEETVTKNQLEVKPIVENIALLIKKYGLVTKIDQIISKFYFLYNSQFDIQEVTITLQERLSYRRKLEVEKELKNILGCKDIVLNEKVDERILGGIKIETSDGLYIDATVRGRISQLRNALIR